MVLSSDTVRRIIACHRGGCEVYVHEETQELLFFPKDGFYAFGDFDMKDWADELRRLQADAEHYQLFRLPTHPRFYARLLPLLQALPLTGSEPDELERACLPGGPRAKFLQLLERAACSSEETANWIAAAYCTHVQLCVEAYRKQGVDIMLEEGV